MTDDRFANQLVEQRAFVQRLALALLRDRDLADEVAQDTLVAAIERPPQFESSLQLRGFLRTIVRRLASAARGDRHRRRLRELAAARDEADGSEQRAAQKLALHGELTAAVQQLPEPYRTAVTLRYLADLPPREIARRSQCSSDVVRQRIHRGLEMLRLRLDQDHGSRAAWTVPLAACLPASPFALLLPVTAMAKKALAAVVLLAIGTASLLLVPWSPTPPPAPIENTTARLETASPTAPPDGTATAFPNANVGDRRAADFVVRVVDARDAAIPDAAVYCWTTGGEPVQRSSDADGAVHFAASEAAGTVLALAADRVPRQLDVPHLAGEQRLVLEPGRRVAGLLVVDGAPAEDGLAISLGLRTALDPSLPDAIRSALSAPRRATTRDGGRFEFAGLGDDWLVGLALPRTHWFLPTPGLDVDDDHRLLLPRPDDQLRLVATRLPGLHGRIVWDDDDSPVTDAGINAHAEFAGDISSPTIGAHAEKDGTFAIGFWPAASSVLERWQRPQNRPPFARIALSISATGSAGTQTFTLEPAALRDTGEVTLRLRRATVRHFLAVDDRGRAVPQARVLADELSAPADAEGRGTFRGSPKFVGAPDHAIVVAPDADTTAATADAPWTFVLPPLCELRLRLHSTDGARLPRLSLTLAADTPLFAGQPLGTALHRAFARGLDGGSYERADGPVQLLLEPDADGLVVLPSPLPDVACTLSVKDTLALPLVERSLRTPAAGQIATVDIDVPVPTRIVHGRVTAADGSPLAEAIMRLRPYGAGRSHTSVLTDNDGSFAFAPTANSGALTVHVDRRGFVSQEVELAAGATEADFRLESGRRVEVRVVDERGAIVPIEQMHVQRVGASTPMVAPRQMLAAGHAAFSCLPQTGMKFCATLAGRRFEVAIADLATAADLVMPTPATVTFAEVPTGFARPETGSIGIRGQCLEPRGEPFPIRLARDPSPLLLPPGRYRFQLVANTWLAAERRTITTELPAAAEVALRAGESALVALQ